MKKTLPFLLLFLLAMQTNLSAQSITVTTSKTTITENESVVITATLNAPADKDVIIDMTSIGTAVLGSDFSSDSKPRISTVAGGNGVGSNANQLKTGSSYQNDTQFNLQNDSQGNIYILDSGNNRVQKWSPGATAGITVAGASNGLSASGNYALYNPNYFHIDSSGNIYIADTSNSRIQKWTSGATQGVTVAGGNYQGGSANQLDNPKYFEMDSNGTIYVLDNGNHRIQKWDPGATTGITVAGGNGYGSEAFKLSSPAHFYLDSNGTIYIADAGNQRIQKWAPGATSGITVAGGNGSGSGANQLNYPHNIHIDSSGNIYIADKQNHRIQKWAPGATSGITIAGGYGQGSNANQLYYPEYFYIEESNETVYIADTYNDRIQKWPFGATSGITVAGGNGSGSKMDQLFTPKFFYIDSSGSFYILDADNNRVQKYQISPQIVIPAGQTSGQVTISATKDNLEFEGTEQIVLELSTSGSATISLLSAKKSPTTITIAVLDTPSLSVESFGEAILINSYPNPTSDLVTVTIPSELELQKIEVYNSIGQLAEQHYTSTISLQKMAIGNYFLKIYTSGGIVTRKVVKK